MKDELGSVGVARVADLLRALHVADQAHQRQVRVQLRQLLLDLVKR